MAKQILTLQPDAATSKDAWNTHAGNLNNTSPLRIGRSDGGEDPDSYQHSFIQFDLSTIPAGAAITSATLTLVGAYSNGDELIHASYVTSAWTVTGAPPTVGSSIASATLGLGAANWNVKTAVEDWINSVKTNYGFHFGGTGNYHTVYGSEDAAPANRPKLVVEYWLPPTITATTMQGTQVSPAASNNSVTPTLSGVYSSPDSTAIAYKQHIVYNELGAVIWDSGKVVEDMLTENQRTVETDLSGLESGAYTFVRDTAVFHGGTASARADSEPDPGVDAIDIRTEAIAVEAGKPYRFNVWGKTSAAPSPVVPAKSQIQWFDAGMNSISTDSVEWTGDTTVWAEYTLTATAPANTAFAKARISTAAVGSALSIYWDDASFKCLDSTISAIVPLGYLKYGQKYKWKWKAWDDNGGFSAYSSEGWFIPTLTTTVAPTDIAGADHLLGAKLATGRITAIGEGTTDLGVALTWLWVTPIIVRQPLDMTLVKELQRVRVMYKLQTGSTMSIYHSTRLRDLGDASDWSAAYALTANASGDVQVVVIPVPVASAANDMRSYWHRLKFTGSGPFEILAIDPEWKEALI